MKISENSDPNFTSLGPTQKPSISSQLLKSSGKMQKSAPTNPNPTFASPWNRTSQRFVVAKKKNNDNIGVKDVTVDHNCKCRHKTNGKCLCLAYQTPRASRQEFFKSWKSEAVMGEIGAEVCEHWGKAVSKRPEEGQGCAKDGTTSDSLVVDEEEEKRGEKLSEAARQSVPELRSGRVLKLVQAFEKLVTESKKSEKKDDIAPEEDVNKGKKCALAGLQRPKAPETLESSCFFSPEDILLTFGSSGLGSQVCSSLDSTQGSSRRSLTGTVRSRRSSSISSSNVGRKKVNKKQVEVTSPKPFKLRTEERGKEKEEEFLKKLQEMMIQEEKQRIPIAQGLPLTTDEPEVLLKPPVKESTRPLDIKLHSDVRAVERAEFDHQVSEKMRLIGHYRMEKRQQKVHGAANNPERA